MKPDMIMKPDMTWLIGLRLKELEKKDYSWFFLLDDGSTISTESPWRLLTAKKIAVTSEDDGHSFGLLIPVNAASRVMEAVGLNPICSWELKEATGDLVLHFPGKTAIEFLNLSCGYDGWRTCHGTQEVFCLGGGRFAEFDGGKK
jgi:hypothetical protein